MTPLEAVRALRPLIDAHRAYTDALIHRGSGRTEQEMADRLPLVDAAEQAVYKAVMLPDVQTALAVLGKGDT